MLEFIFLLMLVIIIIQALYIVDLKIERDYWREATRILSKYWEEEE